MRVFDAPTMQPRRGCGCGRHDTVAGIMVWEGVPRRPRSPSALVVQADEQQRRCRSLGDCAVPPPRARPSLERAQRINGRYETHLGVDLSFRGFRRPRALSRVYFRRYPRAEWTRWTPPKFQHQLALLARRRSSMRAARARLRRQARNAREGGASARVRHGAQGRCAAARPPESRRSVPNLPNKSAKKPPKPAVQVSTETLSLERASSGGAVGDLRLRLRPARRAARPPPPGNSALAARS